MCAQVRFRSAWIFAQSDKIQAGLIICWAHMSEGIPADTERWNNVDSTLIHCQDVEPTFNRRWFNRCWNIIDSILILHQNVESTSNRRCFNQRWNNVDSTLIQQQDVRSTLNWRRFNVVCPLGLFSRRGSCLLEQRRRTNNVELLLLLQSQSCLLSRGLVLKATHEQLCS